mmetsp:Transcript_54242/g.169470  ORF Transcript_54242/g.169470 Transcript_54242/m.169470 type:complete len:232 (-) Transcript_54242:1062-1757(-)
MLWLRESCLQAHRRMGGGERGLERSGRRKGGRPRGRNRCRLGGVEVVHRLGQRGQEGAREGRQAGSFRGGHQWSDEELRQGNEGGVGQHGEGCRSDGGSGGRRRAEAGEAGREGGTGRARQAGQQAPGQLLRDLGRARPVRVQRGREGPQALRKALQGPELALTSARPHLFRQGDLHHGEARRPGPLPPLQAGQRLRRLHAEHVSAEDQHAKFLPCGGARHQDTRGRPTPG